MTVRNVLCFGDSLTWGWVPQPHAVPTTRYAPEERWTGVLARTLGSDYRVLEEGLSGRTTNVDDPTDDRLNGARALPGLLASHQPLDLVIIMLGTNDAKTHFNRSVFDIAEGMSVLLGQIAAAADTNGASYPAPNALVVAPPPLAAIPNAWFARVFDGAHEKTAILADAYQDLASFAGVGFMDAGEAMSTQGIDGIHFSTANNVALGSAIAELVPRYCN
ncbi:SGNH/GDSL hydrolase family protein [Rathayibacter sp. SD072]|uniref:SGNH/GDSL hydrolase family protein n=1 Tax=Rathayibacter sp. SD072 TaxID=2781731 RepID=UPI001A95A0D2|nr:SGNH/GDSL hydrolase family protein [Rathayibacter sp. SD072]MBO0982674.1 SGNH/GDSL hydrolase family protein [Rathayibacter sp. SD072]